MKTKTSCAILLQCECGKRLLYTSICLYAWPAIQAAKTLCKLHIAGEVSVFIVHGDQNRKHKICKVVLLNVWEAFISIHYMSVQDISLQLVFCIFGSRVDILFLVNLVYIILNKSSFNVMNQILIYKYLHYICHSVIKVISDAHQWEGVEGRNFVVTESYWRKVLRIWFQSFTLFSVS